MGQGQNPLNIATPPPSQALTYDAVVLNFVFKIAGFFWMLRYFVVAIVGIYAIYFFIRFLKRVKSELDEEEEQPDTQPQNEQSGSVVDMKVTPENVMDPPVNSPETVKAEITNIKEEKILKEILSTDKPPPSSKKFRRRNPPKNLPR